MTASLLVGFSLVSSVRVEAATLAQDDFSTYQPGSLLGQPAGGSGFTGNWQLISNGGVGMTVFEDGTVGDTGAPGRNNYAGSYLNFANPIATNNNQLFIRYTYTALDSVSPHESSRLDLNVGSPFNFQRVFMGGFADADGLTGEIGLRVERPLFTGTANNLLTDSLVANSGITTPGTYELVGLLDQKFGNISLWVNPTASDFYNPFTGASSADSRTAWNVPTGGLTFDSYSLIRNVDDNVRFNNVLFATDSTSVGIEAVPEPMTLSGIALAGGLLGAARRRRQVNS